MLRLKHKIIAIALSAIVSPFFARPATDKVVIKLQKTHKDARLPIKGTKDSAGYDLTAIERVKIKPGQIKKVRVGFKVEIPRGYELQIRPRSGLASRNGIIVIGSPGTVDSDYRGEWTVPLINLGKETFIVKPGMRIAQMVLGKVPESEIEVVDSLSETERGTGGFGHTGLMEMTKEKMSNI